MAKIYIDPGHGGRDNGASGSGLKEKDWVLEVSLELARILKQAGHSVKLSRSTDKFIGLSARTNDANRWGADIFISIHFNAGGGFGWEDFIFNGNVSSNTRKLQNSVHNAIKPILNKHGLRNRGKKRANFAVLRQSRMPAILLEAGFVDSSDVNALKKSSYKKDVAVAVANGVQNYFGLGAVSKPSKPSKPSVSSGGSVVDYMNKKGMDSSFGNRKKLAKQYEIKNYKGTASQNIELLNKLKAGKPSKPKKSISQMATEIIEGKHGSGHANRRSSLGISQSEYNKVRAEVNRRAGVKSKPRQSVEQMANRIINDPKAPNGHSARRKWLGIDNATYQKVRAEVNRRLR